MKRAVTVVLVVACGLVPVSFGYSAAGADVSHYVGRVKPEQLRETSGVAASRLNSGVLWLHNDGDSGELFAVNTSGKLVAFVKCRARMKDLEEIAIGPGPQRGVDYLYLGDIGDNDAKRREIRVARFAEPELAVGSRQQFNVDDAEEFSLRYEDGPHDAEAMFVDQTSGDLFIVTKEKDRARLYTVAAGQLVSQAEATLTKLGKVEGAEEVSAAAISRDGRQILLRRENQGWLWERKAGESVAAAMGRKPTEVPVLGKEQAKNGESIAFSPAGDSYFTVSEGKKQAIYQFDLPAAE